MGGSGRAAESGDAGRLYEVSRPDGADERAASRFASGVAGREHLHAAGPVDQLRVPPVVDQVLASGGTPLDAATRGVMEPRLGHNLADVRIHASPDAALAARSLQARAFTAGSHVVLGSSAPAAASPAGARLLAHELTHVVQGRHDGTQPVLRRAVELPEAAMAEEKKLRIYRKLGEFAAEVPADAAQGGPAPATSASPDAAPATGAEPQSDPSLDLARQIASYLVVIEDLAPVDIEAVFSELAEAEPDLMSAVALGGRLFRALAELGVSTAAAAGWYVLLTIRDTLAGDFVADPTALAIVLRTLLTLIPGVDTAADIEDLVADLVLGALHPQEKLLSVGWWFAIAITLAGLFPEFGSAVKGTVQLTVKGIGEAGRAGLEALAPLLRRLLGDGWMDLAKAGLGELLDKASTWGPWISRKFSELVDLVLDYLGRAASTVGSAVLDALIDAFRRMKELAPKWLTEASDSVVTAVREADEEITEKFARRPKDPEAIEQEAKKELGDLTVAAGTHAQLAIKAAMPALGDELRRQGYAAGFLDQVRVMTDKVAVAFGNPDNFAAALRKVVESRRKLTDADIGKELQELAELKKDVAGIPGLGQVATTLSPEAAAYVQAVRSMAGDRGVVELHKLSETAVLLVRRDRTGAVTQLKELKAEFGGFVPDDVFMNEVIKGGEAILDFAALELSPEGSHGAITHFLHDLVADEALKDVGSGASAFRGMMDQVQRAWQTAKAKIPDPEFPGPDPSNPVLYDLGTLLWIGTYDRVTSLAQPERLWPPLRAILELGPKEL